MRRPLECILLMTAFAGPFLPLAKADTEAVVRNAYLQREEEEYWQLVNRVEQFMEARYQVEAQLPRIRSRSHLDIAALRVEQTLQRLQDLDANLGDVERFYATRLLPPGDTLRDAVASKREHLKKLRDPVAGAVLSAKKSLRRLIERLEHNEPDVEAALEAVRHLTLLNHEVTTLMRSMSPPVHGCGSPIALLRAIEQRQRTLTSELERLHERRVPRAR